MNNKFYINNDIVTDNTTNELKNVIIKLKESGDGYDDISAKIIKYVSDYITVPLLYTLNLSLTQGIFPNELKKAKVIPLYKSMDKMLFCNYRSISILPVFF